MELCKNKKVEIYSGKSKCCGCGACKEICPVSCITMVEDSEGFLYPQINHNQCVGCKKCESVCPIANVTRDNLDLIPKAYAGFTKNQGTRAASSSGGIFSELSSAIFDCGGVVFGAAFDKDWCVHEVCVDNREDLWRLRGSKYMKNNTEDTFRQVLEELEKGKTVLYSGTPCETEGLRAFLGKDYENLYVQDFVCHGTPSAKLWKKYLRWKERMARGNVTSVSFRSKEQGWKNYSVLIGFGNGKKYEQIVHRDFYMRMFLSNLCLRPSCYDCKFKKTNRKSDITLGDFWGCETVCPEIDDDKGLSLVLVHSKKGEKLLNKIKNRIELKPVVFSESIESNSAYVRSVSQPTDRDEFMENMDRLPMPLLEFKFLWKPKIVGGAYRMLKRFYPGKLSNKG